jgi:hypothetical protein
MATHIASGEQLAIKLCEALGIDHTLVARVILDCQPGEAVTVYVQHVASTHVMELDWNALLEQERDLVRAQLKATRDDLSAAGTAPARKH